MAQQKTKVKVSNGSKTYPALPKVFTDSLDRAQGKYVKPKSTVNKNLVSVGKLKQVRDNLKKSSNGEDIRKSAQYDKLIKNAPKKQINLKEVRVAIPLKEVKVTAKVIKKLEPVKGDVVKKTNSGEVMELRGMNSIREKLGMKKK